ncbi:MAG TPA: DUF5302 domain-containing protein [Nocardioidaceae bacterium]|nr:DUF5302 domain-containing protein [Nocardioidaceae bacterium]
MTDKPSKPTPSDEDELHRKFREALDRKKGSRKRTPESEPGHSEGTGPANADVARKEFRRKTG